MEQRIQSLEDELKLLKNQIMAVLLDVKESLTNNDWPSPSLRNEKWTEPVREVEVPKPRPEDLHFVQEVTEESSSGSREDSGGGPEQSSSQPPITQPSPRKAIREMAPLPDERLDLLTVVMLGQWLDRTVGSIGKEHTGKILEIYDATGNLPGKLKEAMLLLSNVYQSDDDGKNTIMTESLPRMMELDNLMRSRDRGVLESAILSMLAERKRAEVEKEQVTVSRKENPLTDNSEEQNAEHPNEVGVNG